MVVGGMSDAVVLIEEMIPKLLLKTCPGVRQVDSSGHTLVQVVNESQQETITVLPSQVLAAAEEVSVVNVVRPEMGKGTRKKIHINEKLDEEEKKRNGSNSE